MKRIFVFLFILAFGTQLFAAQDSTKLSWKLSGRLLIDGGLFINPPTSFNSGVTITDIRLAGKVRFMSNWYTKIDIGFANNKVSLKDAYIEYGKDGNYFRAGYMLGYFSIDQSTSTNDLVFNTTANVTETFYPGRRIGLSYTRSMPSYYLSTGAFCGDNLNLSDKIKQGYNFTGRIVWRPVNTSGKLFHIGTGILFKVPNLDTETGKRQIRLGSKGVTYIPCPQTLDVTIEDVKNQVQANAECLFFHHKWLFQGEYLQMRVNRTGSQSSFNARGGYVQGGFLIKGAKYGYDSLDAVPVMPEEPHAIMLVCRYNYTGLDNTGNNINGGSQHDLSVGINYYFNQYLSSRINYSSLWTDTHSAIGKSRTGMIQARLQVRF